LSRQKERKMQSLRHMNSDEAIDRAIERAKKAADDAKAAKSGGRKPLFLWLKPGHKATVRPLCARLSGGVKLMKHDLWNKDRDVSISNICACELDPAKPCMLCEHARDNKKVTAGEWFFLPVYVYQVVDEDGKVVTYEEKQEDGSKVEKKVEGVRLLELTAFGRKAPLLKYFKDFPKDPENGLLNERDFTIEQIGEGTGKNFQPDKKNPKPMHESLKKVAATVTEQAMYERIIAFCPPKVAEDSGTDPFEAPTRGKDTDPAVEAVVQGVKNGKVDPPQFVIEELDDAIMDW
jgi:hypothetical protein